MKVNLDDIISKKIDSKSIKFINTFLNSLLNILIVPFSPVEKVLIKFF